MSETLAANPLLQNLEIEGIPWLDIHKYTEAIVVPPYQSCNRDWWCRSNFHVAVAADYLKQSDAFKYALSHRCPGYFPNPKVKGTAVEFVS
ncbi:hypothetical protein DIURU_004377 [Diutina rugosa]|uniref:Uncharacterized protein n=1 Tax=Diutina rugosa TaxID=5481 RepID=A0A642UHW7_DIURU|nr:uncharacterized protein DIURU_004377 [Diutina rugosa]KAA8899355.1 hypothetical protein DIURU_004377 [Diutina rugosa]